MLLFMALWGSTAWAVEEFCDGKDTDGDPDNEPAAMLRGETYHDPFEAIRKAGPNDVVHVCRGGVGGPLFPAEGVIVRGHPDEYGERPELHSQTGDLAAFPLISVNSSLTLESLAIYGESVAIDLDDGATLVGKDLDVFGESVAVRAGAWSWPASASITLLDSIIGSRGTGILAIYSADLVLSGSTVQGMNVVGSHGILGDTLVVDGGTISYWDTGIDADDVTLDHVAVSDNGHGGVRTTYLTAVVTSVNGNGEFDDGFGIWGAYLTLQDSWVGFNKGTGILLDGWNPWLKGTFTSVTDNYGPTGAGIRVSGDASIEGVFDTLVLASNSSQSGGDALEVTDGSNVSITGTRIDNNYPECLIEPCLEGHGAVLVRPNAHVRFERGWLDKNSTAASSEPTVRVAAGSSLELVGTLVTRNLWGPAVYLEPTATLSSSCTWWGAPTNLDDNTGDVEAAGRVYAFVDEDVWCDDAGCVADKSTCTPPLPDVVE